MNKESWYIRESVCPPLIFTAGYSQQDLEGNKENKWSEVRVKPASTARVIDCEDSSNWAAAESERPEDELCSKAVNLLHEYKSYFIQRIL